MVLMPKTQVDQAVKIAEEIRQKDLNVLPLT